MFVGAYLSTGGKKGEAQKTPAFNAKDQDEEKFIQ